jgi:hypothetical protein
MKSIKQKEQIKGYKHSTIINEILSKYRTKLQDMSIKELEEINIPVIEWAHSWNESLRIGKMTIMNDR